MFTERCNGKDGTMGVSQFQEELVMSPKDTPPCGFTIHPNQITYTAPTMNWVVLVQALESFDALAVFKDDTHRTMFTLWRDGLRAAIQCSFTQFQLNDNVLDYVAGEMNAYLPVKPA